MSANNDNNDNNIKKKRLKSLKSDYAIKGKTFYNVSKYQITECVIESFTPSFVKDINGIRRLRKNCYYNREDALLKQLRFNLTELEQTKISLETYKNSLVELVETFPEYLI